MGINWYWGSGLGIEIGDQGLGLGIQIEYMEWELRFWIGILGI